MYHFDEKVAVEVGVNAAIVLENFKFWINKNIANNKHYYDGEYWTYNSIKAFEILFPFWSSKQIRTILNKLIDNGYLNTGNYNKSPYDRTLWYSFTSKSSKSGEVVPSTGTSQKWTFTNGSDFSFDSKCA